MEREENRVRYRLSVNPAVSDRVEELANLFGLHPQQMAYVSMGLGLRMLEQLVSSVDKAASNPEFAALILANKAENDSTADDIMVEALKQK